MALTPELALSLARDAYSASTSYFDASIRKDVEADLRRFQGMHPVGSKYLSEAYRSKSRLFRPKTRTMVTKHEAVAAEAFFSTRDVVSIEPQDDNDPVQQASAALHKELLQFRLTKTIPWFLTVMGAYQDSMTVGLVCSYQHWVYDKQRGKDQPAIDLRPIENIRFDPGASWIDPVNTSPYLIDMIPMYVKDVKARMKTGDEKTGEKKWMALDDGAILAAMRGYSDSIRLQREQGRQDSKEAPQSVTNYAVVWVHKNIVEHEGVDYCYYTLGDQRLLSEPVPLADTYHHGKRPYVIGYCTIETHKNYPGGPNRKARDLQAEANEIANTRIENVKLVLNKRYLVGRNRQVDIRSLTRNVAGSATLVNDVEKDVKPLDFDDVTASSYKEQEVLNLDFDDATGNFSASSVQSNRKMNETVGGMELLSTDANQVAGYQLRTFVETWVEPVLRQLVLLEQAYETDEVILALAGQKAKVDELGFDAITDDLIEQELILSVAVGMGATNPQEKVNRFLTAMRALKELLLDGTLVGYGLKFEEVCKEVFGNMGYKDGSRFFDTENADPRVAQLMQQMQQLQQQLDAKFPPELIDAQVRHIDAQIAALDPKNKLAAAQAVKTGVDASFAALQAAEVVAAVPQAAPVADALMQGAGYRLPTPPGVDPNIPTADAPNTTAAAVAPAGGLATQPIKNNRDGMVTTLPGAGQPGGPAAGDTSPNTPANAGGAGGMVVPPASAGRGAGKGIETMAADSTPKGLADGGLIDGLGIDDIRQLDTANMTAAQRSAFDKYASNENKRLYPEAYGARAVVGDNMQGRFLADDTQHSLGINPVTGLPDKRHSINDIAYSYANGGQVGYVKPLGGAVGMADGGVIQGPGSGTSDSIPAVNADTGEPLAVSNGEFKIPPQVVTALGKDFFDQLIAQYHQPVQGEPAPAPGEPMAMPAGTVIIPADVVAALGADFFERLVKMYGGAP